MLRSFYTTLIFTLIFHQLYSQSFTNRNDLLAGPHHSGVAIGVADMNSDGLDDIVRLSQGYELNIAYQNTDSFTVVNYLAMDDQSQWMIAVADIDNNGYNDLMSGDYSSTKVALANDDGTGFTLVPMPGENFFAQTGNFADIDNDGMLDAFVCDDDAESKIFANTGTGSFVNADYMIDMATNPVSDNSGNYGSIWTDLDNDWDLDLYIAKCRQGVSNPTDGRRINQLFINDGNNNYSENAEDAGLRIGWQSWTADFQDIDNDGDLDVFITNHDYISQLLENNGKGQFTDISEQSGINVQGTPIQGVMRDFDNDGFVDILVAGSRHHLFKNNGDRTFTDVSDTIFDNEDMESYAIGDLNHDGFLDIYGGYANIYTNPSSIEDVLWMNDGNDNNFLMVRLEGLISNRNGVGARIEIHGEFGMQIREVRSGESYGISNSLMQHFGLGTATQIDHVIVKWPSGIVDVIDSVDVNQTLDLVEGNCTPTQVEVQVDGNPVLCGDEVLNLSVTDADSYFWSNGDRTNSITVDAPGNYSVLFKDDLGCWKYGFLEVTASPDETPSISADSELEFCEGGSVTLTSTEAASYLWSNGETTQSITVTETGNYSVEIQGTCADFNSEEITVQSLESADSPLAEDVIVADSGLVTLISTGVNPYWYDQEMDGTLLAIGNEVQLQVNESTTFYVTDVNLYGGEIYSAGLLSHFGGSLYNGDTFNGALIFDVYTMLTLNSVKVYTDTPGERTIELRSSNGAVLLSRMIDIPIGENRIDLNFTIEPGSNYSLTTNANQNNLVLGTESPRFQRSGAGVVYPYLVDEVLSITSSNGNSGGVERYYYFYEWEVTLPSKECASERVPVEVTIDPSVGVQDLDLEGSFNIFPNPANQSFFLEFLLKDSEEVVFEIYNAQSKLIDKKELGMIASGHKQEVDISNFAKGVYLIKIIAGDASLMKRIIVQ